MSWGRASIKRYPDYQERHTSTDTNPHAQIMHRQTELFLTYLLARENEYNNVKLRKLKYGRPSKMLDKEQAKFEKYAEAMKKITIKEKRKRWHPLDKDRHIKPKK